jgi:hypothetical protein
MGIRPSIVTSTSWLDDARCATYDDDYADALFFSEPSSTGTGRRHMREGVRCCLLCVVRPQCLQLALSFDPGVVGIWAGTTTGERQLTQGLPLEMRLSWLERIVQAKASEVLTRSETPAA